MVRRAAWHSRVGGRILAPTMIGCLLFMTGCPELFPPVDNTNDNTNMNDNTNGNDNGTKTLTGQYAGSTVCMQCHSRVHADWEQTLHAQAFETLQEIGQDENETCVRCHVVGLGEEGGFTSIDETPQLAGVGCEACHGPSNEHVMNVADETVRPEINISASVCGQCHTGSHHPNFDEWQESGHSMVTEHVAEGFMEGERLNRCGTCHSGTFFYRAVINNETVADDALQGVAIEDMDAVTCALCHDPHAQTGNAPTPEDGRDFQLRFPEVASPTPTNTIEAATDPQRFNLCGQCHHSRGRDWTATSRPVHHSVQSNVYVGEMPLPPGSGAGEEPDLLVFSRVSVHSFATEQCATCHMYRQDFMDEQAPAIAGHTFEVNQNSCATSGCHPSREQALAVQETLQMEISGRLTEVKDALDAWGDWEYVSEGGPEDQSGIPDEIKKARFLYYYVLNDGSLGLHNPDYVRDMLAEALEQIDAAPAEGA